MREEAISRRRVLSVLGLAAAASLAVPVTVFTATDAEARVGNPGSAASLGIDRRDRVRRYKKAPANPDRKAVVISTA